MASWMPSTHSSLLRSASVSSMRRMNSPPSRLASSQLKSAMRPPPTWKYPVGDGQKRTRTIDERLRPVERLTVVLVHREQPAACVTTTRALQAQGADILIVDNGSSDAARAHLR